jgi:hypothetical protein
LKRPPLAPPCQGGEIETPQSRSSDKNRNNIPPLDKGRLGGVSIKIFTKNPQNINNFLEYNNIE